MLAYPQSTTPKPKLFLASSQVCTVLNSCSVEVYILRKPNIHPPIPLRRLIQEQHPVRGRSLNHLHVQVIPVGPLLGVLVVGIADVTGEEGLVFGALVRELVEREGEGERGERNVEAGLK